MLRTATFVSLALLCACGTKEAAPILSTGTGAVTLTAGRTVQLGATASDVVTWSVDEGASGGTIDSNGVYTAPATPGTYHVTATLKGTPGKQVHIAVTVVAAAPAPTVTAPANVTASKAGYKATANAGGADVTLAWSISGGTITAGATASEVTFTPGASGSVVLTVRATNKAGDAGPSAGAAANIVPPPASPVVQTSPNVTAGRSIFADVVSQPGMRFLWRATNATLGATEGEHILFNAVDAGLVSLFVKAVNAAGDESFETNASINAYAAPVTPEIAAPQYVTAGKAGLVASVPEGAGARFAWSIDNGDITDGAGTNAITFTAGASGKVAIRLIVVNGANDYAPAAEKLLTAVPAPQTPQIATFPAVTEGRAGLVARVEPQEGATYAWSIANGTLSSASGAQVAFTAGAPGTTSLSVVATNLAGDSAPPGAVDVEVKPHGIEFAAGVPGGRGNIDGPGGVARLGAPQGFAFDSAGNIVFADGNQIRRAAADGTVTTLAGSAIGGYADGVGAAAAFSGPRAVAVDDAGVAYVGDHFNDVLRAVAPDGTVTTIAGFAGDAGVQDGVGGEAHFSGLTDLRWTAPGTLAVVEENSRALRQVQELPDGGWQVTTTGTAPDVTHPWGSFYSPSISPSAAITLADGGVVAASRDYPGRIVEFTPSDAASGLNLPLNIYLGSYSPSLAMTPDGLIWRGGANYIESFQWNGGGWNEQLVFADGSRMISGLQTGNDGALYFADSANGVIARLESSSAATPVAGLQRAAGWADGAPADARFQLLNDGTLNGVAAAPDGTVYVADPGNDVIRRLGDGGTDTWIGVATQTGWNDGLLWEAKLHAPQGVAWDTSSGGMLWIADTGNNVIRNVSFDGSINAHVIVTAAGTASGPVPEAQIGSCGGGLALAAATTTGSPADGVGPTAAFCQPMGIAADNAGAVYVADYGFGIIRKLTFDSDANGWAVTTVAGQLSQGGCMGFGDGAGADAQFCNPAGLAVDAQGRVFVADSGNNAIRMLTQAEGAWSVQTIAGRTDAACESHDGVGTDATFCAPTGIAVNALGELYVTDTRGGTVRKLTEAQDGWHVDTVAGTAGKRGVVAGALPGSVNLVTGVAVSPAGDLYMTDGEESALLFLRAP